jgi:hypothetical protein
MWWWWNVALVTAARRLCRTDVILVKEGLFDESMLAIRSMVELEGNQGYMAQQPDVRAPEFAAADLRGRERLIEGMSRIGLDSEALGGDRLHLAVRPQGQGPVRECGHGLALRRRLRSRKRLRPRECESSHGIPKGAGPKEEEPGSGRVAKLSMACEFLMRSLYFADQALFQNKRDFLDAYAAE